MVTYEQVIVQLPEMSRDKNDAKASKAAVLVGEGSEGSAACFFVSRLKLWTFDIVEIQFFQTGVHTCLSFMMSLRLFLAVLIMAKSA